MHPYMELSELEKEILQTFAYFDVFSYPLTKAQLHLFLHRMSATQRQVYDALDQLVEKNLLRSSHGYFYLSNHTDEIVARRLADERRASSMLKIARMVAYLLKHFPFVRAVFLTGSLSKHVSPHNSDIDFMIIADLNRLWVCKMFLTAFRRMFLLNSKKFFCINLMVTERGLYYPDQNYFTAVEIVTTQVVWNTDTYAKYQDENDWIYQYLPNWKPFNAMLLPLSHKQSFVQKIVEALLNNLKLDELDARLMHTARNFWRRKHKNLDEEKFNSIIQCTPDISSVWHDDHQSRIQHVFQERLAAYRMRGAA